jgi:membrane protein required for colicin V production
MDFTLIDYLYIAVAFISTIWAFSRGGVYELVATMSWVVAALLSRFLSPDINEFLQKTFGLPEATIGTLVAAYFIVFFGVLVAFSFINQRLRDWIHDSILQVTDRTFGIIFGILRGILIMGLLYWALLWYYEDATKPSYLTEARTRPIMQLTAVKMHEWFIPGRAPLLERDMANSIEADALYQNLIDPAIRAASNRPTDSNDATDSEVEVGYRDNERNALENQLLQLENLPNFEEFESLQ